jgi:ABC-2 type transport system ATP-binding protein
MDEAEYCDRLALIYRGRIIAEGTPDVLKQEYMKRDIVEIEVEQVVDALEVLEQSGIETAIFGSVLHATVTNAEEETGRIRELLNKAGIKTERIEKIVPSLEDVFVALIEVS